MRDSVPVISILCPTRERPDHVKRFVDSICRTTETLQSLEILFYVDSDDETFPDLSAYPVKFSVFKGPRVWLSNAHNFLAINAKGDILMTGADDMVFRTHGWDTLVTETIFNVEDRICLVFGNDLGTHAGKIATHGFFHRKWFETLGTWVQPGRGSLWDLWSTENAKILGRLIYLEKIVIEHVHYRQSSKSVSFDNTYQYVRNANAAFRPSETYNKLSRERRIDRLILRNLMSSPPEIENKYCFAEWVSKTFLKNSKPELKFRILTLNNLNLLKFILTKFLKR